MENTRDEENKNSGDEVTIRLSPGGDGHQQQVALALSLSYQFIEDSGRGVCIVHGGEFAGTIQVYIHQDDLAEYQTLMEGIFGPESVTVLQIRDAGCVRWI